MKSVSRAASSLKLIAQKYSVSFSNVAVRYVLEQPTVAGAIISARLGVSKHLEDNVLWYLSR